MDEHQIYKISGIQDQKDADKLVASLVDSGFYQCEVDINNSTIIIPIAYAGYIDDIEKVLLSLGFGFEED
jgi:hypothetical protein